MSSFAALGLFSRYHRLSLDSCLVLYYCFVPKPKHSYPLGGELLQPHLSFCSIFSASLRTVIIFRPSWSLSETIFFHTTLWSLTTKTPEWLKHFLRDSCEKKPHATQVLTTCLLTVVGMWAVQTVQGHAQWISI